MRKSPLHERQDEYAARLSGRLAAAVARAGRAGGGLAGPRHCAVERVAYQPSLADAGAALVLDFGAVEAEYAAIRRGAALIEWAQWGVIEVLGRDATAFLDRLVTNALAKVPAGGWTRTFLTNRKGRIEADITAARHGEGWRLQTDRACVDHVLGVLEEMRFGEDAGFASREDLLSIGVHGPGAAAWLDGSAGPIAADGTRMERPWLGSPGVELLLPVAQAVALWDRGIADDGGVRPAGWSAANIARIEAGQPMFAIDFSTDNLPAETAMLDSHVSFQKGCYPGQEVVARMKHLGAPKQVLVGLRGGDRLPEAGDAVCGVDDEASPMPASVGTVTSSACSPMRGDEPIAIAMVRTAHAREGSSVAVAGADGATSRMVVSPLCALPGGFP